MMFWKQLFRLQRKKKFSNRKAFEKVPQDVLFNEYEIGGLYSETTWAVGIAQLTHHEVQGGGKNPETGGRGIFAPTANRVVS